MTVEELIAQLQAYQPHYTVQVLKEGTGEVADYIGEIVGVSHTAGIKIVSIEFQ